MTKKLEHDALIINVTGRQRMLSQTIAKEILLIYNHNQPTLKTHYPDLLQNSYTFHQTLTALKNGGQLLTPEGTRVFMPALHDSASLTLINEVYQHWLPTFNTIFNLNENTIDTSKQMLEQYSKNSNIVILELMNELTVRSEYLSNQTAIRLRWAQIIVFILVSIDFLLITQQLYRLHINNKNFMMQLETLLQDMPHASLLVNSKQKIIYANTEFASIFKESSLSLRFKKLADFFSPPAQNEIITLNDRHFRYSSSNVMTIPREMKLISLIDLSESIALKLKAVRDDLTQALNRTGLIEAYEELTGSYEHLCCLFIDLNKFKQVNDRFGHQEGDRLLQIFTKRLKSCLKEQDVIARLGGDEFIILMKAPPSEQDVETLIQRLKLTVGEDIWVGEYRYNLSFSVGVKIANTQSDSLNAIINDADSNMYREKLQLNPAL
jgi:diguanylate cyclase (GGDEF)-like protein